MIIIEGNDYIQYYPQASSRVNTEYFSFSWVKVKNVVWTYLDVCLFANILLLDC